MPKVNIDGNEIDVPAGYTLLQACEEAGVEIPRFCYHERLSIAGNCRMCLVEWVGAPKPQASCALTVGDLRPNPDGSPPDIRTNSDTVIKARKGVMEFLLINHPLDCPICDQGGECDLQDQAMGYGIDTSRFEENKRAVEEKYMGPLIKTIMTRCIHCTRCVRFATEVAGVPELGAIGRGEDMEITTYLEQAVTSELSGNVIDLCPVGALTSKPYAFRARPWELRKTETIDAMDAVGSNIRVDARGREVVRILPRVNDDVNEEWISDKSRFVWDGLRTQRLDRPFIRENGKLRPATWPEAFDAVASRLEGLDGGRIGAIAGDLACAESMKAMKDLLGELGSPHMDCRQDGAKLGGPRANYLFNSGIAGIEEADALLLIGTNPRAEAAVLNARIRKRWLAGDFPVAAIGSPVDLTYDVDWIGAGPETLADLASGQHPFADVLKQAERPMLILGQGALARPDGEGVFAAALKVAERTGMLAGEWNGFNVLHTAAGRVAGLDLGFLPGEGGRDVAGILEGASSGEIDALFLLGADEIDTSGLTDTFVIYLGTHGDRGAHGADVILPAATYTEKNATYANTEGRVQACARAAFPPGEAREDWTIIRALSERVGHKLPYDSLLQLRNAMIAAAPVLGRLDAIEAGGKPEALAMSDMDKAPFGYSVRDFYLTNPIARASATMAECSRLLDATMKEATGTDG